ncbi:hypothetical protein M409DRAFT_60747 [Zasmidium cellare ATCC 36951]|uniref:Uncharacterized protein n=1 Tax=Zasmidium cellare ATCC 36951 TaxID=1080233 RepID=A0A6A6BXV4_ZASCE|nr:uncharacterized protein M409DRAFT_60747 [Zasmidium cellare ATCC 36951]KAF2159535.1 hypothetical protein M409DRAFT_60747 [Zasmidium cellare ATCC 36951]
MQLSAVQQQRRKANVPTFANHTPRAWEITATDPSSQSPGLPDMFGAPTGMTIGAEPGYCVNMGQAPSSSSSSNAYERERIRKASSTILREDSIQQRFESASTTTTDEHYWSSTTVPLSREDSWSMNYDCTTQAPYSNSSKRDDDMITQSSLVNLPHSAKSYDLAFFLRTTGPTAPHRRPSKVEPPKRSVSGKNAFRFLKRGQKRDVTPVQSASDRLVDVSLNGVLRDEGGLLLDCVEQKVSWTGKPYLALRLSSPKLSDVIEQDNAVSDMAGPSTSSYLSPDILDSRVSICFHEDSNNSDILDSYLHALNKQQYQDDPAISDEIRPATSYEEVASRLSRRFPTPIRPAASNPPTPQPESGSMAESYSTELVDDPVGRQSYDTARALSGQATPGAEPLTPKISLPREEFPVKHPSPEKEVEIKQPVPRRLGSYPVLMQRASSIASTLGPPRSFSDSPGPPPPRSPLRLRRDPRTIESIIASHGSERRATPKIAPSIKSASDFDFGMEPIKATVTTECTGPIKRPKSRNKNSSPRRRIDPLNRKEREERVRARKLRDRPSVSRTIDSVVHAPAQATRQRQKKIRPQITIPDLRPPPLRAPSAASHASASSVASWKKVTQSTQTPVSPVPSRTTDEDDRMNYTPISPTAQTAEERNSESGMNFSPVMMVAEEVPVPKTKPSPKPTKLILKEGKTYAPRPRSASYSRSAIQRRSRTSVNNSNQNSVHSSPRSKSPGYEREEDDVPPLPSPPPTRALPPTPPASGSEKTSKANSKAKVVCKDLPTVPSHDVSPISSTSSKKDKEKYPHVVTQQSKHANRSSNRAAARMDARLEALEKQNALLSAALMAVLRTNGALNGTIPSLLEPESPKAGPMAWESRVARRSAATTATSHTASSSNGSALEMYMSTRRGSRHGH